MQTRQRFGQAAIVLVAVLVVGSAAWCAFGATFGLVSGLVVVMAPLFPLLVQGTLTGIAACACLWRGWHRAALGLGAVLLLGPLAVGLAAYGRELWRCQTAADPAACLAYLHGSPLLPIFVALSVVVVLAELVALFVLVATARRWEAAEAAEAST